MICVPYLMQYVKYTIAAFIGSKKSCGLEGTSRDQVELFKAGPITAAVQHLSQLNWTCPRMEFLQHSQAPAPRVHSCHGKKNENCFPRSSWSFPCSVSYWISLHCILEQSPFLSLKKAEGSHLSLLIRLKTQLTYLFHPVPHLFVLLV